MWNAPFALLLLGTHTLPSPGCPSAEEDATWDTAYLEREASIQVLAVCGLLLRCHANVAVQGITRLEKTHTRRLQRMLCSAVGRQCA